MLCVRERPGGSFSFQRRGLCNLLFFFTCFFWSDYAGSLFLGSSGVLTHIKVFIKVGPSTPQRWLGLCIHSIKKSTQKWCEMYWYAVMCVFISHILQTKRIKLYNTISLSLTRPRVPTLEWPAQESLPIDLIPTVVTYNSTISSFGAHWDFKLQGAEVRYF